MIRVEATELTDVPASCSCCLIFDYGDETMETTFVDSSAKGACTFTGAHFFVPTSFSGDMVVTAEVSFPPPLPPRRARCSIPSSLLKAAAAMGTVVKKLPMMGRDPSDSELRMFLRLRLDALDALASNTSSSPSSSLNASSEDLLSSSSSSLLQTLDSRYRRLMLSLGRRAAIAGGGHAPTPLPPTPMEEKAGEVPKERRMTVGRARAPSKSEDGEDDGGLDVVWKGEKSGSVHKVMVRVGDSVFRGTVLALIRVDDEGDTTKSKSQELLSSVMEIGYGRLYSEGPKEAAASASTYGKYSSVSHSKAPYRMSSSVATRAGYSVLTEQDLRTADDGVHHLEPLVWAENDPGVVRSVVAFEGLRVSAGDALVRVGKTLREQQVAHLTRADVIGFQRNQSNQQGDINGQFQTLSERLVAAVSSEEMELSDTLKCCEDLEQLARDFLDSARTYGRVIISELNLPLEEKTIRPLKLGGVLGGSKYVVRGILFKSPDGGMFSDYPDPMRIAGKVHGHELKGLKSYYGWFFNRGDVGLASFPLTAVIDYKGHRITAMTLLPIDGSNTLIYGSCDAGSECTVRNEVPAWSTFVQEASKALKLKPHFVINGRSVNGTAEITSCIDLEGHKGRDQRFYLLDFSRTFPPAFKADDRREPYDKMWPFYHMLRPEFMQTWAKPLCADAFSSFQSVKTLEHKDLARENNAEIREATDYLMTEVVSKVCSDLLSAADKGVSLTHRFHRHGLNMRYLGLVYERLVSKDFYAKSMHNLYRSVQAEALMRVMKASLRTRLRKAGTSGESAARREAAHSLNLFFGHTVNSSTWNERNSFVLERLQRDFYFSITHAKGAMDTFLSDALMDERDTAGTVTKSNIKLVVLERLDMALGLGISKSLLQELRQEKSIHSFREERIFDGASINFVERVKYLDVVDRARGLSQFLRSYKDTKAPADTLFSAFETIEKVLEASPTDPWVNLLMGDICNALWDRLTSEHHARAARAERMGTQDPRILKTLAEEVEVAQLFCDRASTYYQQAVLADQATAHRSYGQYLMKLGHDDDAEDHFLSALEACDRQGKSLDDQILADLSKILEKKGNIRTATALKEKVKAYTSVRDDWHLGNVTRAKEDQKAGFRLGGNRLGTTVVPSTVASVSTSSAPSSPLRPPRKELPRLPTEADQAPSPPLAASPPPSRAARMSMDNTVGAKTASVPSSPVVPVLRSQARAVPEPQMRRNQQQPPVSSSAERSSAGGPGVLSKAKQITESFKRKSPRTAFMGLRKESAVITDPEVEQPSSGTSSQIEMDEDEQSGIYQSELQSAMLRNLALSKKAAVEDDNSDDDVIVTRKSSTDADLEVSQTVERNIMLRRALDARK